MWSRAVIKKKLRDINLDTLRFDSAWVVDVRDKVSQVFGMVPCLWQIKVSLACLRGDKHVVSIARTGSGKTLTFWIPLLLATDGILIIVVPLNLLGKQNVDQLARVGIDSIVITGDTATPSNFKDIHSGKYRVVITNPEMLMKPSKFGFAALFKNASFTSNIISLIFDEAHCISEWNEFRMEYREIGRLRFILHNVPFYFTSATLPEHILNDVLKITHISRSDLKVFRRSNDRPNVYIEVREFQHSMASFKDLDFLIEGWSEGKAQPRKSIVLFDSITDCVDAASYMRSLLPRNLRNMVRWHNSSMSREYREGTVDDFINNLFPIVFATDTLGMGMNISDVEVVLQHRAHRLTMSKLLQRLGRGARDLNREAVFILLVESKFFERNKKNEPAKAGKKRASDPQSNSHPSTKRQRSTVGVIEKTQPSKETKPSTSSTQPLALEAFLESRRKEYDLYYSSHRTRSRKKGEPKGPEDLGPALRDLINAEYLGIKCFRIPMNLSFNNDTLSTDYKDCRPNSCSICSPPPSRLCCAGEHPAEISVLSHPKLLLETHPTLCPESSQPVPSDLPQQSTFRTQTAGSANSITAAGSTDFLITPAETTAMEDFPACSVVGSTNPQTGDQHIEAPRTTAMENLVKKKGKSRLAKYETGPLDLSLDTALDTWRQERTVSEFGECAIRDYGPSLIMPNDILDRIVACAHWHKLQTVDDIWRETDWFQAEEFGHEVLDIILKYRPPPPPPATTQDTQHSDEPTVLGNKTAALNMNPTFADPRVLPPSDDSVRSKRCISGSKKKISKSNGSKENNPQGVSSQRCTKCSQPGHNRRTCPLNEAPTGLHVFHVNPA